MLARLVAVSLVCAALAAQESTRPNVLVAIADDWSWGHASVLGTAWVDTPHFDRVCEEGVLFTRAYTPNAKCAPSRACLLTGRNSWQLGAAANHIAIFPPEYGGFVEALAASGYRAGFTGKGWGPGIAEDAAGRPRAITGERFAERRSQPPASGIANIDYAANFADFVAAGSDDPRPWVFWYGALEPHRGYEAGSGVRAGKDPSDIAHVPECWPDDPTVRGDMLDYAVEVEHFDAHLGRILGTLEAAGALDDTLVIVTSDHGMPFPRMKGQAYEGANHVPLAVRWPAGVPHPGRRVDDLVSLIDVAPTILRAAGVNGAAHGMAPVTGRSLAPLLGSDRAGRIDPTRDHVLIGKERHDVGRPHDHGYPIRGIVTARWLYLENFATDRWPAGHPLTGYLNCDGSPTKSLILERRREDVDWRAWELCFGRRPARELYQLDVDRDCVVNLAGRATSAAIEASLAERMTGRLTAEDDPRMRGDGDTFEGFPVAWPGQRGFYERFVNGEDVRAGWVNRSDYESEVPTPERR